MNGPLFSHFVKEWHEQGTTYFIFIGKWQKTKTEIKLPEDLALDLTARVLINVRSNRFCFSNYYLRRPLRAVIWVASQLIITASSCFIHALPSTTSPVSEVKFVLFNRWMKKFDNHLSIKSVACHLPVLAHVGECSSWTGMSDSPHYLPHKIHLWRKKQHKTLTCLRRQLLSQEND